jgi:ABC-type dipeptide/oligopeptide/nickel transport system permease component
MVDYWMGRGAKAALARKTGTARYLAWFERLGPKALLVSFLPVIGDPMCTVAGWLRLPFWPCVMWIAIGRVIRYSVMTGLLLWDTARAGEWEAFGNALSHLALPASLLGYFSMAYISRMTRSFMLTELSQEYVVAARAKGLSEARIIWRHALRNAAVPLVTVIALSYAGLLEGSVLTETVFAWPGLGLYITNSLQNADMNAVLGGTIVVGTIFVGLNLLSDLLYRLLDPRTRQ